MLDNIKYLLILLAVIKALRLNRQLILHFKRCIPHIFSSKYFSKKYEANMAKY